MNFFEDVFPSIGGGLFNGIGNFLGARANNRTVRRINRINIANQNAINDLNYQRQIEFFNRVNEYNSPKSVMQRYKDAGVNPNFVAAHISGGMAQSPIFRAEAGTARAPLSNSNFLSHAFNLLGNITTSLLDDYKKDRETDRARQQSDTNRKNSHSLSQVSRVFNQNTYGRKTSNFLAPFASSDSKYKDSALSDFLLSPSSLYHLYHGQKQRFRFWKEFKDNFFHILDKFAPRISFYHGNSGYNSRRFSFSPRVFGRPTK